MITPSTVFPSTSAKIHGKLYSIGYGSPHHSIPRKPVVIEVDGATGESVCYQMLERAYAGGKHEVTLKANDFGEEAHIVRPSRLGRLLVVRLFNGFLLANDVIFYFPFSEELKCRELGAVPSCCLVNTSTHEYGWMEDHFQGDDVFREVNVTSSSVLVFFGSVSCGKAALKRLDLNQEREGLAWEVYHFQFPPTSVRHPKLLFHDEDDYIFIICVESRTVHKLHKPTHQFHMEMNHFNGIIEVPNTEKRFQHTSLFAQQGILYLVWCKDAFQKLAKGRSWNRSQPETILIHRIHVESLKTKVEYLPLKNPHMPTVCAKLTMKRKSKWAILTGYCADPNCRTLHELKLWKPMVSERNPLAGWFEVQRPRIDELELWDDEIPKPKALDLLSPGYRKIMVRPMESDDKKEIFDGLEGSDGGLKQERRTLSALEDPRSRTAKSKTSVLLLSGSRYVPMETEGPHQKEASPSSPVPSHPLDQHVPRSSVTTFHPKSCPEDRIQFVPRRNGAGTRQYTIEVPENLLTPSCGKPLRRESTPEWDIPRPSSPLASKTLEIRFPTVQSINEALSQRNFESCVWTVETPRAPVNGSQTQTSSTTTVAIDEDSMSKETNHNASESPAPGGSGTRDTEDDRAPGPAADPSEAPLQSATSPEAESLEVPQVDEVRPQTSTSQPPKKGQAKKSDKKQEDANGGEGPSTVTKTEQPKRKRKTKPIRKCWTKKRTHKNGHPKPARIRIENRVKTRLYKKGRSTHSQNARGKRAKPRAKGMASCDTPPASSCSPTSLGCEVLAQSPGSSCGQRATSNDPESPRPSTASARSETSPTAPSPTGTASPILVPKDDQRISVVFHTSSTIASPEPHEEADATVSDEPINYESTVSDYAEMEDAHGTKLPRKASSSTSFTILLEESTVFARPVGSHESVSRRAVNTSDELVHEESFISASGPGPGVLTRFSPERLLPTVTRRSRRQSACARVANDDPEEYPEGAGRGRKRGRPRKRCSRKASRSRDNEGDNGPSVGPSRQDPDPSARPVNSPRNEAQPAGEARGSELSSTFQASGTSGEAPNEETGNGEAPSTSFAIGKSLRAASPDEEDPESMKKKRRGRGRPRRIVDDAPEGHPSGSNGGHRGAGRRAASPADGPSKGHMAPSGSQAQGSNGHIQASSSSSSNGTVPSQETPHSSKGGQWNRSQDGSHPEEETSENLDPATRGSSQRGRGRGRPRGRPRGRGGTTRNDARIAAKEEESSGRGRATRRGRGRGHAVPDRIAAPEREPQHVVEAEAVPDAPEQGLLNDQDAGGADLPSPPVNSRKRKNVEPPPEDTPKKPRTRRKDSAKYRDDLLYGEILSCRLDAVTITRLQEELRVIEVRSAVSSRSADTPGPSNLSARDRSISSQPSLARNLMKKPEERRQPESAAVPGPSHCRGAPESPHVSEPVKKPVKRRENKVDKQDAVVDRPQRAEKEERSKNQAQQLAEAPAPSSSMKAIKKNRKDSSNVEKEPLDAKEAPEPSQEPPKAAPAKRGRKPKKKKVEPEETAVEVHHEERSVTNCDAPGPSSELPPPAPRKRGRKPKQKIVKQEALRIEKEESGSAASVDPVPTNEERTNTVDPEDVPSDAPICVVDDVEPSCGQEPQVDNVTVTVEFPEVVVDPEPVPSVTEEDSQKTVGPDEPLNLKEAVPSGLVPEPRPAVAPLAEEDEYINVTSDDDREPVVYPIFHFMDSELLPPLPVPSPSEDRSESPSFESDAGSSDEDSGDSVRMGVPSEESAVSPSLGHSLEINRAGFNTAIVENSTLKDQMERRNISSASCHPVEDMIYINVTSDEEPEDALAFMASTFTTLEQATNEVTALEPRLVEKEAEPQSEENEERGADVALDQLDPVENVEPTTTTFTEDDKDVTCQSPVSPSLEQDLIESASTISDSEKAMLETEIDVFREDSDVSIDPLEEPQLVVSTELVQTEEPTEQQDLAMATSEEQDKSASVPEIAEAQADLTEVHPDQGPDEDLTDPIVFEEPECVDSTDLVEEEEPTEEHDPVNQVTLCSPKPAPEAEERNDERDIEQPTEMVVNEEHPTDQIAQLAENDGNSIVEPTEEDLKSSPSSPVAMLQEEREYSHEDLEATNPEKDLENSSETKKADLVEEEKPTEEHDPVKQVIVCSPEPAVAAEEDPENSSQVNHNQQEMATAPLQDELEHDSITFAVEHSGMAPSPQQVLSAEIEEEEETCSAMAEDSVQPSLIQEDNVKDVLVAEEVEEVISKRKDSSTVEPRPSEEDHTMEKSIPVVEQDGPIVVEDESPAVEVVPEVYAAAFIAEKKPMESSASLEIPIVSIERISCHVLAPENVSAEVSAHFFKDDSSLHDSASIVIALREEEKCSGDFQIIEEVIVEPLEEDPPPKESVPVEAAVEEQEHPTTVEASPVQCDLINLEMPTPTPQVCVETMFEEDQNKEPTSPEPQEVAVDLSMPSATIEDSIVMLIPRHDEVEEELTPEEKQQQEASLIVIPEEADLPNAEVVQPLQEYAPYIAEEHPGLETASDLNAERRAFSEAVSKEQEDPRFISLLPADWSQSEDVEESLPAESDGEDFPHSQMEHEVSESVTFTARSPEWKMECSNSSTTPPSESDVASPASVEACAAGSPSESIASVPSQGKTEAAETLLAMAEDTVEPQIDDSFNEEDWLAPRTHTLEDLMTPTVSLMLPTVPAEALHLAAISYEQIPSELLAYPSSPALKMFSSQEGPSPHVVQTTSANTFVRTQEVVQQAAERPEATITVEGSQSPTDEKMACAALLVLSKGPDGSPRVSESSPTEMASVRPESVVVTPIPTELEAVVEEQNGFVLEQIQPEPLPAPPLEVAPAKKRGRPRVAKAENAPVRKPRKKKQRIDDQTLREQMEEVYRTVILVDSPSKATSSEKTPPVVPTDALENGSTVEKVEKAEKVPRTPRRSSSKKFRDPQTFDTQMEEVFRCVLEGSRVTVPRSAKEAATSKEQGEQAKSEDHIDLPSADSTEDGAILPEPVTEQAAEEVRPSPVCPLVQEGGSSTSAPNEDNGEDCAEHKSINPVKEPSLEDRPRQDSAPCEPSVTFAAAENSSEVSKVNKINCAKQPEAESIKRKPSKSKTSDSKDQAPTPSSALKPATETDPDGQSSESLGETRFILSEAMQLLYPESPPNKETKTPQALNKAVQFLSSPNTPLRPGVMSPTMTADECALSRPFSVPLVPPQFVAVQAAPEVEVNTITSYPDTIPEQDGYTLATMLTMPPTDAMDVLPDGLPPMEYETQPGPSGCIDQDPYGTESYALESYVQESYTQEAYGSGSYGHETYASGSYGTDSYRPESYGSEYYGQDAYMTAPMDEYGGPGTSGEHLPAYMNSFVAPENSVNELDTTISASETMSSSASTASTASPSATPRRGKNNTLQSPSKDRKGKASRHLAVSYSKMLDTLGDKPRPVPRPTRVEVAPPPPPVRTIRRAPPPRPPPPPPPPPREPRAHSKLPSMESEEARIISILEHNTGRAVTPTPKFVPIVVKEPRVRKKKTPKATASRRRTKSVMKNSTSTSNTDGESATETEADISAAPSVSGVQAAVDYLPVESFNADLVYQPQGTLGTEPVETLQRQNEMEPLSMDHGQPPHDIYPNNLNDSSSMNSFDQDQSCIFENGLPTYDELASADLFFENIPYEAITVENEEAEYDPSFVSSEVNLSINHQEQAPQHAELFEPVAACESSQSYVFVPSSQSEPQEHVLHLWTSSAVSPGLEVSHANEMEGPSAIESVPLEITPSLETASTSLDTEAEQLSNQDQPERDCQYTSNEEEQDNVSEEPSTSSAATIPSRSHDERGVEIWRRKAEFAQEQVPVLTAELDWLREEVASKEKLLEKHERADRCRDEDIVEARAKIARANNSSSSSPTSGSSTASSVINIARAPVIQGRGGRKRPAPAPKPSEAPPQKIKVEPTNSRPSTSASSANRSSTDTIERLAILYAEVRSKALNQDNWKAMETIGGDFGELKKYVEDIDGSMRDFHEIIEEIENLMSRRDFLIAEIARLAQSINEKRETLKQLLLSPQYVELVSQHPKEPQNPKE